LVKKGGNMNDIVTPPKQKESDCSKCVHSEDCVKKLKHMLPVLDWILGVQKFNITITMCKRFMYNPNAIVSNKLEILEPQKGKITN